jgi:hypothetical protein
MFWTMTLLLIIASNLRRRTLALSSPDNSLVFSDLPETSLRLNIGMGRMTTLSFSHRSKSYNYPQRLAIVRGRN